MLNFSLVCRQLFSQALSHIRPLVSGDPSACKALPWLITKLTPHPSSNAAFLERSSLYTCFKLSPQSISLLISFIALITICNFLVHLFTSLSISLIITLAAWG